MDGWMGEWETSTHLLEQLNTKYQQPNAGGATVERNRNLHCLGLGMNLPPQQENASWRSCFHKLFTAGENTNPPGIRSGGYSETLTCSAAETLLLTLTQISEKCILYVYTSPGYNFLKQLPPNQ